MTVIAWDGKVLAADKLSTQYGQNQTVTKVFKGKDYLAGITGDACVGMELVEWIKNGGDYPKNGVTAEDAQSVLIVVRKDGVFKYMHSKTPLRLEDEKLAFGAGQDYAMAAMHCGLNAAQAVVLTNTLSKDCGGGVDAVSFDEGDGQ